MWQDDVVSTISKIIKKEELKITCIVGAGASVASGLKTFRGNEGHYKGKHPKELASPFGFKKDPKLVWEWYQSRLHNVFSSYPNAIHHSLVELEKMNILVQVITQNVDGYHHLAGQSENKLIEIHGNILETHCFENCGKTSKLKEAPKTIPVNCECGSYQRPSVVWFGETINIDDYTKLDNALKKCNVLVVIGTSGYVMPVSSFPLVAKNNGAKILEFNIEETPFNTVDDIFVKGSAEKTIPEFVNLIKMLL